MNYQKAIEAMCRRCINHDVCGETGCEPKKILEKLAERGYARPAKYKTRIEGSRLCIGYCPMCGAGITQANFCGSCGQRIDWSEEVTNEL